MYRRYFKRVFDFSLALFAIVLISPILIILIIYLAIYYKGTPFFTQRRPGLNNEIFKVIKFKSMIDAFDESGQPLPNKDRITNVGRFLRGTSLDELPQLFNILIGDMSFVGPRPLFESYLGYYKPNELLRHNVRPGVTGLSQVSGRNYLDWDTRLGLDVEYVEKLSFRLDLEIFYKTFLKVVKSEDVTVVPKMTPLYKIRDLENNHLKK